ncbi:MAG: tetratricopeptide repeat protein [Anaerolineales bacterium]
MTRKRTGARWGVFPASFASSAAAAIWEMEVDETENLLGLLLRYSLIDFNETSTRYELHDLLAEFTRGQMVDEEEQETRIKHASHYKDVMSVANALYEEGGEKILQGLRLFDLEWEHIRSAHVWLAEHLETSKEIAGLAVPVDAPLDCLDLRLAPKQKIEWLNVALSASRKLGVKICLGGALLGNLGIVFKNLGDARKAIQLHEQAQVIHREIGDRRGESRVLGNLGVAYADLGEVRKAIELYEQCLTLLNEIGDRRAEGSVLGNLGVAYADLGEIRKAIELYERQLVIVREIGDRRGESTALCNLGLAYYTLGDPHKAIKFYEQALVIDREIGDRRGEGATLGNLGTSHATLGEIGEAIKSFEQQLSIACEISDPFGRGGPYPGNLGVATFNLKDKERGNF